MRSTGREQLDWWLQAEGVEVEYEGRAPRKKKKAQGRLKMDPARSELAEELYAVENDYAFTYKAARHEQQWLSEALRGFYDDSLISDVLRIVKGGKEANVYCCRGVEAEPSSASSGPPFAGETDWLPELLAAKVYRPRFLRQLRNDAVYKEGRVFLGDDGKALRDGRSRRAIQKKTRVGSELSITSWIEHEFQTLRRLHAAGVDVPYPLAQAGNAILMEFIGDEELTAPTLTETRLPQEEAWPLFERSLYNIELMLANGAIHADLSAYNILYWGGEITLIDFPQVVDPLGNPKALELFSRDVERVCQYFARYGIRTNPPRLAKDLWNRHASGNYPAA
jgi:RIO kinase 1